MPRCHLLTPIQEGTHQKLFSQEKNLNSASKVVNWIIVDILMYLINLMLSLAKSFLLEIMIAKDHELSHSAQ